MTRRRDTALPFAPAANSTSAEVNSFPWHQAPPASQDITALNQRIAELTEANAQLAEAVASRDTFLAVAAHELRNPMTSIAGYVQLLRRNLHRPEVGLDKIDKDLERLDWVVEDYIKRATVLLDMSRITTGRLRLKAAPVDVCDIIQRVSTNFRPAANHAGSPLQLDLPAKPVVAEGDALAIEQIVDNLLSNAIKYGDGKPIILSASADPGRRLAVVHVRDGGPGISQIDQARIFQRFERAVQASDRTGGFGVGLWLVRQLSEAMNGSVAVSSVPGLGSAFSVTFQLHTEEQPA